MSTKRKKKSISHERQLGILDHFYKSVDSAEYVIAVDFESTCCDNGTIDRRDSEIIEFGCALINAHTNNIVSTFTSFVRPRLNPTLTQFCMELTTITQDDVDGAKPLKFVLKDVVDWLHPFISNKPTIWISWGQYDFNKLNEDCLRERLSNPFEKYGHVNFKEVEGVMSKTWGRGLNHAVAGQHLKWHGTHHRGIDDAINVANIYIAVLLNRNK